MTILALSDIHGAYDETARIIESNPSADVIIIAGDLTTYGKPAEAESAIVRLQRFGKPVFVVAGNMDPPELEGVFERLSVSLNGRGVVVGDVGFCGVSASPISPLMTPNEISEAEIAARAAQGWKEISAARWKVFVPHAPPHNTRLDIIRSGRHVGSTAVRRFIEEFRPHAVVCGHIHEARGVDVVGTSKVVNCGPAGHGMYSIVRIGSSVEIETLP
ncbi:MAG TPA: metallophosphoesterase [Bacteroidota bacterium]|nr:metallophosphoesterase [Bacteroidota bacterium]